LDIGDFWWLLRGEALAYDRPMTTHNSCHVADIAEDEVFLRSMTTDGMLNEERAVDRAEAWEAFEEFKAEAASGTVIQLFEADGTIIAEELIG